jgi:hypothetical protein
MARGWESKAVADQIEEGNSRRDRGFKGSVSAEAREQQERLRSLLLSRSRVLQQLDRARHPGHRDTLLKGLKAIEKEIDEVSAEVAEGSK